MLQLTAYVLSYLLELKMTKPFPALCRDCKYSKISTVNQHGLDCLNSKVNSKDAWALASAAPARSSATEERSKTWFAACGMKGKLWEAKE